MTDYLKLVGSRYSDLNDHGFLLGVELPRLEVIEDQSYLTLGDLGISLVFPDHISVSCVQLYGGGHEGYSTFRGALPAGLAFNMSKKAVRERLGIPSKSGQAQKIAILGNTGDWDVYAGNGLDIHLEYAEDNNSISLISITSKERG